jgi:AraC-like DNA-binding protein
MDRLTPLLARFDLSARVFHTGPLCAWADFDGTDGVGHIHLVREGRVRVVGVGHPTFDVTEPTLLFYPRPSVHELRTVDGVDVDVLCASVDFGVGLGNPLLRGLPDVLVVPLDDAPALAPTLDLLFAEAFDQRCGRQVALDRLTEYLVIQLLRHAMAARLMDAGALSGLADPRLSKAINAMHERPAEPWTLASLAELAGMSRARFAANFRSRVGATPLGYLTDWRLGVARTLLRQGRPMKRVASEVGYASSHALARAFTQRLGLSPTEWLRVQ